MKIKTTKRAFIASALSLLLCASMLIGTTFAWFTDSVTSGNNVIKSGNLDVNLYYWDNSMTDKWVSIVDQPDVKLFKNVEGEDILWEPGATGFGQFEVANEGSLALKYQLKLEFYNATATADGKTLADVLSVYAVARNGKTGEDDKMEDSALEELRTEYMDSYVPGYEAQALTDFVLEGYLLPGESFIYELGAFWDPTENDNDYNIDGGLSIDFGVTLVATQMTYEQDSYDDKYDEDSTYSDVTYSVSNKDEFAAVLNELSARSDIESALIKLVDDVEWKTGAAHGSTPLIAENASVKNVTINGNGNTLTATGAGVGPIRMANGGTLTLKNIKIVDKSESYAEDSWEFGYLEFDGNLVFDNCEVVNAIMIEGENAVFTNCSFNSNHSNEYAVWVGNGSAVFTNCIFTGHRGLKTHEAYGSEVTSIVVDKCFFGPMAKKPGIAIGTMNADTEITIKNSTFTNCQAGDQNLYIYETDTDISAFTFVNENNIVVNNAIVVTTADALVEALENENNVILMDDVKIDPANMSNAYGTTGINIKNGQTIDGQGNTLDIKGAGGTWDSGINTTGGVIKNITVTGSFRGIFINHNSSHGEKVYLENVIIDGTTYTISCDQGTGNGLEATNSTFNGWTSYAATLGDAKFVNCNFGEGNGYAYCRPYATTAFVGCDFEAGFQMDARAAVTFENCTIGGQPLTAENLSTLVTSNIANATVIG